MREDARVRNQEGRKKDFEERELEKKRRKDEKKLEKRKREEDERNVDDDEPEEQSSGSGKKREREEEEKDSDGDVCVSVVEDLVEEWVEEIQEVCLKSMNEEEENAGAWDDVHGGDLPPEEVAAARNEEVGYMKKRGIWHEVPIQECWNETGKAPVSVRWVDVNKGGLQEMIVRSRLVARDFKGMDNHRDDLFAETPPLEGKRLLISRAATRRRDGRMRKLLFVDARKAHLNPKCERNVYIELPVEAGGGEGMCGKLDFWLYGFRDAAAAWERFYCEKLEGCGFTRGTSCGVVFYHPERDLSGVVHGDDFTFCGLEEDLKWIEKLMESWFEIKVRGMLGMDDSDDKEIVILGRIVRYTKDGITYEADPKHRRLILEYFGFDETTRALTHNGDKEGQDTDEWDLEELPAKEATEFRGMSARMNFLGLDSPDLQFPVKRTSREMSNPRNGSWKRIKKIARYLLNRTAVVWKYDWQDEPSFAHTASDSDWGGTSEDRKSTSAGIWMIGSHCIKTWSASQGAVALSSAEAEFYAMVEAVTRAKGLMSLASELGFRNLSNVVHLGTDSSAAKSFVCRRGLGKMRHLEIRDLWLQKEVMEGRLEVSKIKGDENPSDLMTKILSLKEIIVRLEGMSIKMEMSGNCLESDE